MAEFDTVIRGGTIVDGTRVPRYRADLAIKDGRIAKIDKIPAGAGTRELDAGGMIVAPGAIDLHTHYDAQLHWDPYCSIGGWHGVTSVTIGNCGFGFAPVHAKDADRAMLALSRNESIPLSSMQAAMDFKWETFPQWMDHLDRMPLGVNLSQLVPVSPLVAYVMGGFDEGKKRPPNEREMTKILALFDEAMAAGAMGWSAQRLRGVASGQRDYDGTLMISDLLPDEFYLALAGALGRRGEGFMELTQFTAIPNDPAGLTNDFAFNARLSQLSGRPILYNALIPDNTKELVYRAQMAWLEEANRSGARVFGQTQTVRAPATFTFEDWNLFDNSEIWCQATVGDVEERMRKLSVPETRRKLCEEYDRGDVPIDLFGKLETFVAQKVADPGLRERYQGRRASEIAASEGKHVIDALLDLSVADRLRTEWKTPVVNDDPKHIAAVMGSPYTMPGLSDGGAHVKFFTQGIWVTDFLSWLVRDAGLVSLEEAHFRLSGLMAWAASFHDRGVLREGKAADVLVYDLERLGCGPTEVAFDLPAGEWRRIQRAEGYRWILVNGAVTFEEGQPTGAMSGKLLRHGRAH